MSEWTIEGDDSMRWDVIHSAPQEPRNDCDKCGLKAELFHNEATGLALCEKCDLAEDDRHSCDGCRGDGVYYGAGGVVNGVFKGFTGTCYRCGGKGHQTSEDVKRNTHYDNHVRRFTV